MSEDYATARRAAREEIDAQRRHDAFWNRLHQNYPITRGHKELARRIVQKNLAKVGDMTEDDGIHFLGTEIEKEIGRRARRDADLAEANVYSGGPGGSHGHSTDGTNTFEPDDSRYERDPRELSLGQVIKNRRQERLKAQRNWNYSPKGDRRDHGKRA